MNRNPMRLALPALLVVLTLTLVAAAGDTSSLRPPKGSKVALIVFEDMQCPDCARAAPLLHEAAKKYNIPLIQYDFPLPMHNWSYEAAVNARYFDTKSKQLGDEYRLFIFQNQPQITKDNLRGMTERFASDHKVTLPFVMDPDGSLGAKVKADFQLGQKVGLEHTPTIYVVSDTTRGKPIIEVVDRTQLYSLIDQVMKDVNESPAPKATTAKSTSSTTTTKKAAKPQ